MDSVIFTILKFSLLLVAVLMTFFILLQEGKGGGLSALGGTKGASVEGVTNPIRRATAYLAVLFFLLAIILGVMANKSGGASSEDLFKKQGAGSKDSSDKSTESGEQVPGAPGMNLDMSADPMPTPPGAEAIVEIPPREPAKAETKTGAVDETKTSVPPESKTAGKTEAKTGSPSETKTESAPAKPEEVKVSPNPPSGNSEIKKSDAPAPVPANK